LESRFWYKKFTFMTDNSAFIYAAKKIADQLCINAYWYGDKCNWTGIFYHSQIANSETILRALPSNFYEGSAGVAFFLSAMYEAFPEDIYKKTALGAWTRTIEQLPKIRAERIGFYEGIGGISFALTFSGKWLKNKKLILEGINLAKKLTIENKKVSLDLMDGVAGAIVALNAIHKEFPNEHFNRLICLGGDELLAQAKNSKHGIFWQNLTTHTGYSQGNSGIIHALAVVYALHKNPIYLEVIQQAVRYENNFFSEKYQNWKDLRLAQSRLKGTVKRSYMTNAWCNGAGGIGLSRLISYQITNQDFLLEDAMKASSIMLNKNSENPQIMGLCHGLIGDLYLLQSYDIFLDNEKIKLKIKDGFDKLVPFIENLNFPDSQNHSLQNPSFMQGWAGIGYYFLSLHNKNLPNILSIGL
jgi:lantibiotic biosynthesis protein